MISHWYKTKHWKYQLLIFLNIEQCNKKGTYYGSIFPYCLGHKSDIHIQNKQRALGKDMLAVKKKAVASLNRKLLKRDLHFYKEDLLQEILKIVRTRATQMICK